MGEQLYSSILYSIIIIQTLILTPTLTILAISTFTSEYFAQTFSFFKIRKILDPFYIRFFLQPAKQDTAS